MNLVETHDLLTLAAKYDNRRFDDATVMAWQEVLADLPFDDCRIAVVAHFGEADVYLMPVHVVRGATEVDRGRRRRIRELREASERLELESAPRTDRSREISAAIREMLPAGNPDALRRAEWLDSDKRRDRLNEANANPDYDPTVAIAAASEADDAATRAATLAATKGP